MSPYQLLVALCEAPPLPKLTPGMVAIAISNDPNDKDPTRKEVEAELCCDWAIHPGHGIHSDEWSITHIGTGRRLFSEDVPKEIALVALALAEATTSGRTIGDLSRDDFRHLHDLVQGVQQLALDLRWRDRVLERVESMR